MTAVEFAKVLQDLDLETSLLVISEVKTKHETLRNNPQFNELMDDISELLIDLKTNP